MVAMTWNVCTLVEAAGSDQRTHKSRLQRASQAVCKDTLDGALHLVDHKLDFLVKGLKQYGIVLAIVQEMMAWQSDGYTSFHSGHPLSCNKEPAVRNEGVGITLDERVGGAAWRNDWEAVAHGLLYCLAESCEKRVETIRWQERITRLTISVRSVYTPTAEHLQGLKQDL